MNLQLRIAVDKGDLNTVKDLLNRGAIKKNAALIHASSLGHIDIVEYLLNHGANVHANHDDALIEAVQMNHINVVKLLIKYTANINTEDDEPLLYACCNKNIELIEYLLNNGANIQDSFLIDAAEDGYFDVVKILLKYGANVHTKNDKALLKAIKYNHLDIVKLLITYQADMGAINNERIYYLYMYEYFDMINLLIVQAGIKANQSLYNKVISSNFEELQDILEINPFPNLNMNKFTINIIKIYRLAVLVKYKQNKLL